MKSAPYCYAACRVDRVVDGDTVDLWINLGFSTFVKKRVRLQGIDAPESRTRDLDEKKRGLAAKARLIEMLHADQTGETALCDLESHEIGKYGRVLGTLWIGDLNINRQMLVEGFAKEYHGGRR